MKAPLIVPMPGNEVLAGRLASLLQYELGEVETRHFPDGETYFRLRSNPEGRPVAILCTLDHPDDKLLRLLFSAATARELGASKLGLVAPYLAYMRQDRRFQPGEAVTSKQVAALLSNAFDWLVTVDPHLHRYGSLAEIYTIPTRVVHAAPLISAWIKASVRSPLIIGPDSESEQWVAAVAAEAGAPYSVLEKVRRGDRDIDIKLSDTSNWVGHTPVLVDDIISSGRTMIEAARLISAELGLAPVCVAVHGLFAENSDELLAAAGARVVTCNTVPHPTNAIDICDLIVPEVGEFNRA
jgi:ribose-phosphate pyrophosphokinase